MWHKFKQQILNRPLDETTNKTSDHNPNQQRQFPFIFRTRQKHRWLFHKYPLPQPSIFKNLSSINKKYLAPIYFLNSSRHLVFLKPKVYTPVLSSLVSLTLREPTDSWVQNLSVSVNFGCLQEALTCIW